MTEEQAHEMYLWSGEYHRESQGVVKKEERMASASYTSHASHPYCFGEMAMNVMDDGGSTDQQDGRIVTEQDRIVGTPHPFAHAGVREERARRIDGYNSNPWISSSSAREELLMDIDLSDEDDDDVEVENGPWMREDGGEGRLRSI